jgi:hypothetical protein
MMNTENNTSTIADNIVYQMSKKKKYPKQKFHTNNATYLDYLFRALSEVFDGV